MPQGTCPLPSLDIGVLAPQPDFHEERGDYFQLGISGGPGLLNRVATCTHVFPPGSSSIRLATRAEIRTLQEKESAHSGCVAWVNEKCDYDLDALASCLTYMVAVFREGRSAEQLFSPDAVNAPSTTPINAPSHLPPCTIPFSMLRLGGIAATWSPSCC